MAEARPEAGAGAVTVPCWIRGKLIYLSTQCQHPRTHTLTDLKLQAYSRRTDVLPIERDRSEPKALVTVRAPKEVRDDVLRRAGDVLRRQADDVDAVQEREDVRREDLPYEHARERGPEDLETFVVRRAVEVKR